MITAALIDVGGQPRTKLGRRARSRLGPEMTGAAGIRASPRSSRVAIEHRDDILGVRAGATRAFHPPLGGRATSRKVGTFGGMGERLSPVPAIGRFARRRFAPSTRHQDSTAICMSSRGGTVITSGVLRKGTMSYWSGRRSRSSADRFCVLPGLMVPTVTRPRLARAAARTSAIVRRAVDFRQDQQIENATVGSARNQPPDRWHGLSSERLIAIPLERTNRV